MDDASQRERRCETLDPEYVCQLQRTSRILGGLSVLISVSVLLFSAQLLTTSIAVSACLYVRAERQKLEGVQPPPKNPFLENPFTIEMLKFGGCGVIASGLGLYCATCIRQRQLWAIYVAVVLMYLSEAALIAGAAMSVRNPTIAALIVVIVLSVFLVLIQAHRGLKAASVISGTHFGLGVQLCPTCRTAMAADSARCQNCRSWLNDGSETKGILYLVVGIVCAIVANLLLFVTVATMSGYFGIFFAIPYFLLFVIFEAPALILISLGLLRRYSN